MLQHDDFATPLSRFNRAKETRGASANDYHICFLHAQSLSLVRKTKEKGSENFRLLSSALPELSRALGTSEYPSAAVPMKEVW
jgi:hypothetical protein